MLQTVSRYPELRTAHTYKRAFSNIIVNTVDIGVGMVNNVVLLFPDEIIAAQGIQREAKQFVYPFTGRIAAVIGIMHDVKPDTGKHQP